MKPATDWDGTQREYAALVAERIGAETYNRDDLYLTLGIVTVDPATLEIRTPTDDPLAELALELTLHADWIRENGRAVPYCDGPAYVRPYRIDARRADQMRRTLAAYGRAVERIRARTGYPDSARAQVAEYLEALGVSRGIVRLAGDAATYADNAYRHMSAGETAEYVARRVDAHVRQLTAAA